ncbi:FCD domain-containing protein [Sphingomonas sp. BN140010]|uniref:FCD domain-containing protein n=1 Tax=Sphingomonas arvum TaxID=2992113 RepID=A0ABT3JEW1_9SPHN|nr:FCD domain-containing protein [Sphingomonas sp. BN140010]MCW3797612.1 FCD domain-containing protein [Sphingomonas sp. BN140010]
MDAAPAGGARSLSKTAMDAVRRYIHDEQLRVGDALPGEGFFAERLGVSRAVMREAFGALAALKLIDVANGRRARVAALDGSAMSASLDHAISTAQIDVADVWDVRRTIELRTAELAARHSTLPQARKIVAIAERLASEDLSQEQLTAEDIQFHLAIAEASGNPLFYQIVSSFVPLMRVAVPTAWETRRTPEQRREIRERHRQLAKAIAEHEPEQARQCMAAHFDESIGALLSASPHASSSRTA